MTQKISNQNPSRIILVGAFEKKMRVTVTEERFSERILVDERDCYSGKIFVR